MLIIFKMNEIDENGARKWPKDFGELKKFIQSVEVDMSSFVKVEKEKPVASSGGKISEDSTTVNVAETPGRKQQQQRLYPCDECEKMTNHTTEDHHFGPGPPQGNNKTMFKNKEAFKPK